MTDWDSILRDHGPTVWRTLWRLLANRADCDECFQETFLAALKFARSPAAKEGVRNWSALLQRLATARAVDRLRQRYQHKAAFDPAADPDSNAVSHRPGPVELATASELSLRLRQALARLPEAHAEAFCLHALSGWSYEEVGRANGMSSSAVGVNVHRARQRLKELLPDLARRDPSSATGGLS